MFTEAKLYKIMMRFLRTMAGVCVAAVGSAVTAPGATVGAFTGGDPDEGLDFQGFFTYAVNVGPSGAAGKVGDATFTGDDGLGVTVTADNAIGTGGWGATAYGESTNDLNLSLAMDSIRWALAPTVVTVRLAVETGIEYKLQLLFREDCCSTRGFNVVVNGNTEVPNFMPGVEQSAGGDFQELKSMVGAVVTHQFTATNDVLEIILDGPAADSEEIGDRNAILNAFTLERISPVTDSDADGLRDDWENRYFGNLDQTATGDADNDGLSNAGEFGADTNPLDEDTDGDGLSDGQEVNVLHTDPLRVQDSDGDGISDGAEITIYNSNPNKADTDDDTFNDYYEVHLLTDPTQAASKPKNTLVNVFTGPDPGQGLDLQGTFTYAVNAANEVEPGQIHDAYFTADSVEGVTLLSSSVAGNWNTGVYYGDSGEQQILTTIMNDIRWSAADSAIPTVSLTLANLERGASYKLQLLFSEFQWARGFDVSINGRHVVEDFAPYQWQGGGLPTPRTNGVVITHSFVVSGSNVVIVLDGRTVTAPEMTDHNPIIQAATLELVLPNADTDGDSLPDAWETDVFGGLTQQNGTGDPDSDGLPNLQEFNSGADPNKADTDGDGLSDGVEVNTHQTSPFSSDTDGDRLSDREEVETHHTNPTKADSDDDTVSDRDEILTYQTDPAKADTDGDGANDGFEINYGLDPLKSEAATQFRNIVVQSFFGGDPDEGLDLQGNFKYAFNVGSPGAAGRAGDADFTADNVTNVIVTAGNDVPNWAVLEFGDTANDDTLERVLGSIRWSQAPARWRVDLLNLVPGSTYKLQILVFEQCCGGRGFNVIGDGELLAESFQPAVVHNGAGNTAEAAVISAEFTTQRDRLTLFGDGPAAPSEEINDRNATLGGITLEILSEVSRPTLTVVSGPTPGSLVLTFEGTLQSADTVTGTYADVTGTSPMTVTSSGSMKFYRAVRR